ncbi:hypothetical protein B0H17DRAFT_1140971 [Mycena rosella]|uniref:Uncharacterized protein n=1 Tax=Mycena rosella TaxID=1033263 RepID=A0AAD7D0Q3_MYCRO|nr:hypothetical protein B0H17DRAFT_1140971 [Mycena rosella]
MTSPQRRGRKYLSGQKPDCIALVAKSFLEEYLKAKTSAFSAMGRGFLGVILLLDYGLYLNNSGLRMTTHSVVDSQKLAQAQDRDVEPMCRVKGLRCKRFNAHRTPLAADQIHLSRSRADPAFFASPPMSASSSSSARRLVLHPSTLSDAKHALFTPSLADLADTAGDLEHVSVSVREARSHGDSSAFVLPKLSRPTLLKSWPLPNLEAHPALRHILLSLVSDILAVNST